MADHFHVDVQGFEELRAKIMMLANDKSKKTEIIGILRQVASGTVSVAKANAPMSNKPHFARKKLVTPGGLRRSIGVIVGRKGKAKDNPTVYVGPRAKGANNGWYGHFVEEDTNVYARGYKRKKRTRGANIGSGAAVKVKPGQHFLKKAYETTEGKATAESADKIAKYIQRRIDRLS